MKKKSETKKPETVNEETAKLETEEVTSVDTSSIEAKAENTALEKEEPLHQKVVESFEYVDDSLKQIEEDRKLFLANFKKQNVIKWVVGLICLAIVVTTWILVPNLGTKDNVRADWVLPVMIVIIVLCLVATFTYSVLLKKSINKKTRLYFDNYYENLNKFVFQDKSYSDVTLQKPGKISMQEFTNNKIYADVIDVGSRGLTEFKYNNLLMMEVEAAAQTKNEKRMLPVFVGKYLVGPSTYPDEDVILIYIKGDNRSLPPTNISELKNVLDEETYLIYTNNSNWKKYVSKDALNKIKKIKTGGQLVDVAISLCNGKSYVCLGYDDPMMVLPLEHAFDPSPMMEFKEELLEFCQLIEAFNK